MKIFFRTFYTYFRSSSIRVVCVLIFTLIAGVLPSLRVYISMKLINIIAYSLQSSEVIDFSRILILVLAQGLISIISELILSLQSTFNSIISEKFSACIMTSLSEYLAHLQNIKFFEDKNNLIKIEMVREQIQVRPQNFCFNICLNLQKIINVISLFVVLVTVDYLLPILMLCSTIPGFLISQRVGKKQMESLDKIQGEKLQLTTYIKHSLDSEKAKDNFLFGFVKNFKYEYIKKRDSYLAMFIDIAHKGLVLQLILGIISALISGSLFIVMIFIVIKKKVAVGAIAGYVQAFMQAQYEIQDIATYGKWYFILMKYFENYFALLDWSDNNTDDLSLLENKTILNEKIETIELKNVWFSYTDDEYVIKNLSLFLDAKKSYAIVGKNGSGKTTLVKLLMGFYIPQKGSIIINGKYNLHSLDVISYRSKLSAVFQDFSIYTGYTIDENIFVKPTFTIDEIDFRNKKIEILGKDFKQRLQNSYSNIVGAQYDGEEFSGGEKQRIASLRAFLKKSDVIFFDEPTSAIDPIYESEFIDAISEQAKNKIALIVTHRMGSVKSCDEIIVFDLGQVKEAGAFDVLIKQNGLFAELYNSQRKNFIENVQ